MTQRIEGIGLSFDSVDAPVPFESGDQHDGAVAHTAFEIEEADVGLERSGGLEAPVGRREVQEGQAKVLARQEHQGLEAARLDGELRRVRLEDSQRRKFSQGAGRCDQVRPLALTTMAVRRRCSMAEESPGSAALVSTSSWLWREGESVRAEEAGRRGRDASESCTLVDI